MFALQNLLQFTPAPVERAHVGQARQRFIKDGAAAHLGGILFEVTYLASLRVRDTAGIGLEFPGDEPEQSRFAGAVKPDQTNASIIRNRPAYMVEDDSPAKGLRDVIERQHYFI